MTIYLLVFGLSFQGLNKDTSCYIETESHERICLSQVKSVKSMQDTIQGSTHAIEIRVADQPHHSRYVLSSNYTARPTLLNDTLGKVVPLGFEDGGLVETDGRGMDGEIEEYNIRISNANR